MDDLVQSRWISQRRSSTEGIPKTPKVLEAADQSEATSSQFIIECSEPLMGRYLSIQLMQYGSLQLDEVKVLPEPGNLECFHFMYVCV